MSYHAPLQDMLFVVNELAPLSNVNDLRGFADVTPDMVSAVLEASAKFCSGQVAPLNQIGDQHPSVLHAGRVTTPDGFKEAFRSFAEAGWQGVQQPPEFGGQGLPKLVGAPCLEMLKAASLAFGLVASLTDGAIEAILTAGSAEQKAMLLEPMIAGRWTGTMNLTEPQAGSDLAAVRTRAVPQSDGSYKLYGTKIFITYGEHDLAENIIHLVLARVPDGPPGVKGLSLFVVPKYLINLDGSLGDRNDVKCISLEHKLGIKASPTAVLQFGDEGGAKATLVGELNRGLEYMFIMMNNARFSVGLEGIGLADRAYQRAVAFAKERVQSRAVDGSSEPVPIIDHPDVRRMLMSMRAHTEAARALAYVGAALSDVAHHHLDPHVRAEKRALYEFLVPVIKGWATEMSQDVARDGVQVHGGMGFIEETGAAQYYRDAKILSIYEGTTAIQANDLIGRKTVRDGGATAHALLSQVRETSAQLVSSESADLRAIGIQLARGADAMQSAVQYMLDNARSAVRAAYAGSVPYLRLTGIVLGAWQMGRAALIAHQKLVDQRGDAAFLRAKIITARFFAEHILSQTSGLQIAIVDGSAGVLAVPNEQF